MSTRKKILIAAAVLVSAVVLYQLRNTSPTANTQAQTATAEDAPPAAMVRVAPAVDTEFAPLHRATGSVISRHDARIASEQDGRIVRIADVGQRVEAGAALAVLDDTALRLREREAKAELARIDTLLEQARRQERRYAQLADAQNIARAQYEQLRSDRDVLAQERARAAALLEQTRHQRAQMVIRAPFAGVVVEQHARIGEFLARGAQVARLVDTSGLEIQARAPVALAAQLAVGDPVRVRAEGERSIARRPATSSAPASASASGEYRITAVVPVGDEASRQLEIRVALDDGRLPVGSAVELAIPSEAPRQVVAVPRDAVLLRRGGNYVYRVDTMQRAQRVDVELGEELDGLVEVDGELSPGDLLVVLGGERLEPGQPVRIEATEAVASHAGPGLGTGSAARLAGTAR
ncbi:efflux RND transporter periplasmic adaptor subunit [Marilutibacter chinensis]|uniref:Efflux RND transporter periplasmic adaptor subunit n=1 Tax=Marilutibacter chinensis TaxID=2912247 RepID=A0ABS9HPT3_9GAMM|nr:efflux RND transporter periplasmic adaptor subunit [Lysobacter chinensis]MCF7220618.1 efflux RND transporter periplasmic adaptor subunit [Lysobacter chinensis]